MKLVPRLSLRRVKWNPPELWKKQLIRWTKVPWLCNFATSRWVSNSHLNFNVIATWMFFYFLSDSEQYCGGKEQHHNIPTADRSYKSITKYDKEMKAARMCRKHPAKDYATLEISQRSNFSKSLQFLFNVISESSDWCVTTELRLFCLDEKEKFEIQTKVNIISIQ